MKINKNNAMAMLVTKNNTNNTMCSVQELHL